MEKIYYYFAPTKNRLRYGDDRLIRVGTTHTVEGPLKLCHNGLHASDNPLDALQYARTNILYTVKLGDKMVVGTDKVCSNSRTYLQRLDCTEILEKFARQCALDVVHMWDAPQVVIDWLKTGDKSLKEAANSATHSAARSAAHYDAYSAAHYAANSAAHSTANSAAYSAARSATHSAARSATHSAAYYAILSNMVNLQLK